MYKKKCSVIFKAFVKHLLEEKTIIVALLSPCFQMMTYICTMQDGQLVFRQTYVDTEKD